MPTRIITWNVNGIRAAVRKRFREHITELRPDVLFLQEVRCLPHELPEGLAAPEGYHALWHPAERRGYAGTATWTRAPQGIIGTGMDGPDPEGRILRTRTRHLELVNLYLPSGSSKPEAQARKDVFMEAFRPWAAAIARAEHPVLLAGDMNVAHTPDDIHNPSGNKRNSGFLPHEREWFTALLGDGWTDLVRAHVGSGKGPYSWWSNRGRARAEDRGWRIDYVMGNAAAAARLKKAWVVRQGGLDTSDHAPVVVELRQR